jgi:hypothetical protein
MLTMPKHVLISKDCSALSQLSSKFFPMNHKCFLGNLALLLGRGRNRTQHLSPWHRSREPLASAFSHVCQCHGLIPGMGWIVLPAGCSPTGCSYRSQCSDRLKTKPVPVFPPTLSFHLLCTSCFVLS